MLCGKSGCSVVDAPNSNATSAFSLHLTQTEFLRYLLYALTLHRYVFKKAAAAHPSLVPRTLSDNWTCNSCMKPAIQHRDRNQMGSCPHNKLRHQDGLFCLCLRPLSASLSIPLSLSLSLSLSHPVVPSVSLSLSAGKLAKILCIYTCST